MEKMLKPKNSYISKYYIDYIWKRLNKKHNLSYTDISQIIKRYHELAREDLALGEAIYLKNQLGNLRLEKEKREISIDSNGDVLNKLPINIRATTNLWKEMPELKNKRYIRFVNKHSDGYLFRLRYQISKATFKYKNVYTFHFNATVKKKLYQNIIDRKVDAYVKSF